MIKELTVFECGDLKITAKIPEEDYEWVYLLFTRNSKPFKALKDFGYEPLENIENEQARRDTRTKS